MLPFGIGLLATKSFVIDHIRSAIGLFIPRKILNRKIEWKIAIT